MSLAVRPHTAADYAVLPDIDAPGVASLTTHEQKCLDDIGMFLCRNQSHGRFGVSLLHSHFPVMEDELFLETSNPQLQTLLTRLIPAQTIKQQGGFPVNLRFSPTSSSDLEMIGLEYTLPEATYPIAPVGADDVVVLEGVKQILNSHECLDRFGVRLLNRDLECFDDEVFLETCHRDKRELHCAMTARADQQVANATQTFWAWERVDCPASDGDSEVVMQTCSRSCVRVCSVDPSSGIHGGGIHNASPHTY